MTHKILIAGETGNHCLETAYHDAFLSLGHEVRLFDTKKAIQRYVRPYKWFYQLHRFFPVDAWIKKANKDLVYAVRDFQPDLVLAFTAAEILPGTIAYLKSTLPAKVCWYWADPLLNLNRYLHGSLPLIDMIFSYSEGSLGVFEKMGAEKTAWMPFAGDLAAHHWSPDGAGGAGGAGSYTWDISFIGSWRPERERALQIIHQHFPGFRIKVSGPYWHRCTYKPLKKIATSKALYGKDFSDVVRRSLLNLNVMDDTNYPASNMRFFEIFAAGGTQLCSAAPEMETLFRDKEQVLYFSNEQELIDQIRYALDNKAEMEKIGNSAHELLISRHLYKHRAESMLNMLK